MSGKKAISATERRSDPAQQERPEDALRDLLERALILAESSSYSVLQHIIEMGLEELNEMDCRGSYYALLLREAAKPPPRSAD